MKLENEFTVDVSAEDVWNVLLDLQRVTPCLPGASLNEETGDDEYDGTMKLRLGPVTQEYNGTVRIEEADESEHRAVLKADGKDARGQGTASATITSTLHGDGNGSTLVRVETDMQLTGRAAQFGRGVQQDVAKKILNQFAECLEKEILNGGAEEESASAASGEAGEEPSADGAAEGGSTQQEEGTEALDLGAVSQGAILERVKPLAPIVAGIGALVLVIWLLKRGGSGSQSGGGGRGEFEARLRF